jgi:hypothetical protein
MLLYLQYYNVSFINVTKKDPIPSYVKTNLFRRVK